MVFICTLKRIICCKLIPEANKVRSSALVRHIERSFELLTVRFFKQCSARMIRWETMDHLAGQCVLLLGLRCDARDSRFYSEGFKRDGFQLLGDDAERSS